LMADADVPLILLVDRNTASAAEVFTAALQENGRALVVGEKTYGKGLVQTIARLQDGSALVVTVARYETPLGRDINRYSVYLFYWYKSTNTDAEFI
jgi:carboxyl-terminal processing protease